MDRETIPEGNNRLVGKDVARSNLLGLVGEVEGKVICDLTCGQGWVARELARRGAQVTGLDLAPNLLIRAHLSDDRRTEKGYKG